MDGAKLLDDTWVLDLDSNSWKCIFGNGPGCKQPHPALGPGGLAFASEASVGLYKMVYGGMKFTTVPCPGTRGSNMRVPVSMGGMFALNLATFFWERVDMPADNIPPGRSFGTMVRGGSVSGYKTPLIVFGGANLSGAVPQLFDDIWVCDGALNDVPEGGLAISGPVDKMVEFDGVDDILTVKLPDWCKSVTSMSLFVVDFWTFYTVSGTTKTIFVDAYADGSAILRWYAAMDSEGNVFISLIMPGKVSDALPPPPLPT